MKIICVGNPFVDSDNLGPRVYAELTRTTLPDGVELIDGGLAGLDLLRFVGDGDLVFVDAVQGFGNPGDLIVLTQAKLEKALLVGQTPLRYDHAAGLTYLLHVIPVLYPGIPAKLWLVGKELGHEPFTDEDIQQVAAACLQLVCGEQARC